jgi:hypothetical protein
MIGDRLHSIRETLTKKVQKGFAAEFEVLSRLEIHGLLAECSLKCLYKRKTVSCRIIQNGISKQNFIAQDISILMPKHHPR